MAETARVAACCKYLTWSTIFCCGCGYSQKVRVGLRLVLTMYCVLYESYSFVQYTVKFPSYPVKFLYVHFFICVQSESCTFIFFFAYMCIACTRNNTTILEKVFVTSGMFSLSRGIVTCRTELGVNVSCYSKV